MLSAPLATLAALAAADGFLAPHCVQNLPNIFVSGFEPHSRQVTAASARRLASFWVSAAAAAARSIRLMGLSFGAAAKPIAAVPHSLQCLNPASIRAPQLPQNISLFLEQGHDKVRECRFVEQHGEGPECSESGASRELVSIGSMVEQPVHRRSSAQPPLQRPSSVTQHRARAAWAMPSPAKLIMLMLVLQPCDPASLSCQGMAVCAQECTNILLSAEGGLDADKGVAGALVLRGGCRDPLPARVAVLRPECEAEGDTREEIVEGSREAGTGLNEAEWARSAKDAHENGSTDLDRGSGKLEADYQDACVVCCESTQHWAIGACGHRVVCPACSLRMRVLLNSTECVTCKRVQPFTIVTPAKCVFEELAKRTSTMLFDTSANVFYDDALAYARMEALRGFHCTKWYTSDVCARVVHWSC